MLFLNQTISYLRLISVKSKVSKVHSGVFALSPIQYTKKWVVLIVLLVCVSSMCTDLFRYQFNLMGSFTTVAAGKAKQS